MISISVKVPQLASCWKLQEVPQRSTVVESRRKLSVDKLHVDRDTQVQ